MALKAVLLSLFLFPGSGHLYLKRHTFGLILIVVSLASLAVLFSSVYETAQLLSYRVLDGEIDLDPSSLSQAIRTERAAMNNSRLDTAMFVLVGCWLIGVLDSYRVGKQIDKSQTKNGKD